MGASKLEAPIRPLYFLSIPPILKTLILDSCFLGINAYQVGIIVYAYSILMSKMVFTT